MITQPRVITLEEAIELNLNLLNTKKTLFSDPDLMALMPNTAKRYLFGQDLTAATFEEAKPELVFIFTAEMITAFYNMIVTEQKSNAVAISLGAWSATAESAVTNSACPNRPTLISNLCKITYKQGEENTIEKIQMQDLDGTIVDSDYTAPTAPNFAYEHPLGGHPPKPTVSTSDMATKCYTKPIININ